AVRLTIKERFKGRKLIAVTAARRRDAKVRVLVVGARNVSLKAGQAQTVRIALNAEGRRLLARRHALRARLRVTQAISAAPAVTVSSQIVTFKVTHKRHSRHTR